MYDSVHRSLGYKTPSAQAQALGLLQRAGAAALPFAKTALKGTGIAAATAAAGYSAGAALTGEVSPSAMGDKLYAHGQRVNKIRKEYFGLTEKQDAEELQRAKKHYHDTIGEMDAQHKARLLKEAEAEVRAKTLGEQQDQMTAVAMIIAAVGASATAYTGYHLGSLRAMRAQIDRERKSGKAPVDKVAVKVEGEATLLAHFETRDKTLHDFVTRALAAAKKNGKDPLVTLRRRLAHMYTLGQFRHAISPYAVFRIDGTPRKTVAEVLEAIKQRIGAGGMLGRAMNFARGIGYSAGQAARRFGETIGLTKKRRRYGGGSRRQRSRRQRSQRRH